MCCPFLQAMAASLERRGSLLLGGARVVQSSLFIRLRRPGGRAPLQQRPEKIEFDFILPDSL